MCDFDTVIEHKYTYKGKGKDKCHLMPCLCSTEVQYQPIPNLGARRGWAVSTAPRPLYLRERSDTHFTGGWVGPRAGLDRCGKCRLYRD